MNKKEILFLWDGENWNPNGDMLNDNAPRMDEESGVAEATDVRIKRTIRDELIKREGSDRVFIKEYKKGNIVFDCKRAIASQIDVSKSQKEIEDEILSKFIDIRAFGGVLPISDNKKKGDNLVTSVNFTGPIQFRMSKSLHRVAVEHIKGTGAFASGDKKTQATFREENILKYALFATYGIIDNYNAEFTKLSEDDVIKILDGLWFGTKNLITRSKMGQTPRFMLIIEYKDDSFAGDLNNSLDLIAKKDDEAIRSLQDYSIDFTRLKNRLNRYKNSIESIKYMVDFDFEEIHKSQFPENWEKIER